ncbi:hypothetical protein BaRGS_00030254 [Batillaria attramentaria]|uniref:Uncharacterized protein n=1 Tax=Batillaria attramentaria TaxID=370345 RepID=A0ABD0JUZ7_9CAEN
MGFCCKQKQGLGVRGGDSGGLPGGGENIKSRRRVGKLPLKHRFVYQRSDRVPNRVQLQYLRDADVCGHLSDETHAFASRLNFKQMRLKRNGPVQTTASAKKCALLSVTSPVVVLRHFSLLHCQKSMKPRAHVGQRHKF